jgi:hypothetical protein|tara:strand:+ start:1493 stop:1789 length:297 start_codon:yes stop_codon:yes gene_type:complete
MAVIDDVLVAVNNILNALGTKAELGSWGTPSDYSILVRQDQPDAVPGGTQYMVESVTLAASEFLARRGGACGIQAVQIDDILSRTNNVEPGDPFTGSL